MKTSGRRRRKPLSHLALRLGLGAALLLAIVLALATAEWVLRAQGNYLTWAERNGIQSNVGGPLMQREPWLWVSRRLSADVAHKTEFDQVIEKANSEGLAGPEIPLEKGPGEFRIFAVGDSFTEGIGDPGGKGYPGLLETELRGLRPNRPARVFNAGASGSDPVYYFQLIQRRLARYRPDLVIMTVNNSDVSEVTARGGMDRFDSDGYLRRKSRPWQARLMDHSHLARAWYLGILHLTWSLIPQSELKAADRAAADGIFDACLAVSKFSREAGFKLLIVFHPASHEISRHKLGDELLSVQERLSSAGVDFLDVSAAFFSAMPGAPTPEYVWPIDKHYTRAGYKLFAHSVALGLRKRHLP